MSDDLGEPKDFIVSELSGKIRGTVFSEFTVRANWRESSDWHAAYEALQEELICGCGDPDEDMLYIREIMRARKAYDDEYASYEKIHGSTVQYFKQDYELRPAYKAWMNLCDLPYNRIILHYLNEKGLFTHGGSIGSSWFEDDGESALEILNDFEKYNPEGQSVKA